MDFDLENLRSNFSAVSFGLLVAGLIIGSSAVYLGLNMDTVSADKASDDLVQTLEAQTGQDLEVLNSEKQRGLYRVDVKNQNDQVTTYYVTRDGNSFITENALANLDQVRAAADARNEFSSCLSNRNVVMFGNASQRATQLQIRLMGGQQTVAPIYADVNNQQVRSQASQLGVQSIPSFYYNGSALPGPVQLNQIQTFTGCQFQLPNSTSQ